jgi:hypothetical protein
MIHLPSKPILQSSETHLAQIQQQIDSESDFEKKVNRAKSEWDNKSSTSVKKGVFDDIKGVLKTMCVDVETCNYCENSEATDIEHIFPKRLFPDKAFRWDNYLLACGKCNSHLKKDKFAVFAPPFSDGMLDITPKRDVYEAPVTNDTVFINPRVEDPLHYIELDLKTFLFTPRFNPDAVNNRDETRADYTITTLGLSTREQLRQSRETEARNYLSNLKKYVQIKKARSMDELDDIVHFPEGIDKTQDFSVEQNRLLNALRNAIQQAKHPTVWKELVRQRDSLSLKEQTLFLEAPEAVFW